MQSTINFTPQQLKQYSQCPDVNYMGGHMGGISSCVYCAQIFRRYRIMNGQQLPTVSQNIVNKYDQTQYTEKQAVQENKKFGNKIADNDGEQCGKLVCMKAGFCTCDFA